MFAGEAFAQTSFATITCAFNFVTTSESFTLSDSFVGSATFGGGLAEN